MMVYCELNVYIGNPMPCENWGLLITIVCACGGILTALSDFDLHNDVQRQYFSCWSSPYSFISLVKKSIHVMNSSRSVSKAFYLEFIL